MRTAAHSGTTLLLLSASLGLAGCLGGGDDDKPSAGTPEPQRTASATPTPTATPLATAQSSVDDPDYGGMRFDLMALNRVDDKVVAQIRLTNEASEDIALSGFGGSWTEPPPGGYADVSGFALADAESRRLYSVLREPDGDCVCTRTDALDFAFLDPGADFTVYAVFPAPPESTETVALINPIGPPFPPAAITDGEPPALPRADELPDLATVSADEPVVLPIKSLADSLDKSRSIAETDREVEIRLSTDVLFAIDSARLSGRARGILNAAAAEIKAAGARSVRLEGHADSTGNDAINDPLSERRAAAVARALRPLVGTGVTFTARGYGSRRPVASNDEPEGRRRNRRVSVVYARPPDSEASERQQPTTADAGEPASGKSVDIDGRDASAGEHVTVELEAIQAAGRLAVLTFKVTNSGDNDALLSTLLGSGLDDTYRFKRQSITGPTLVDRAARQRYFVASVRVEGDEVCLCSDTAGANLGVDILEPGQEGRFYTSYVVGPQTQAVTVEMGPDAKIGRVAIERDGP